MKTTMTLSQNLHASPFEIFDREVEEVILMINFYIALGDTAESEETPRRRTRNKEERIKVDDSTATGGWY